MKLASGIFRVLLLILCGITVFAIIFIGFISLDSTPFEKSAPPAATQSAGKLPTKKIIRVEHLQPKSEKKNTPALSEPSLPPVTGKLPSERISRSRQDQSKPARELNKENTASLRDPFQSPLTGKLPFQKIIGAERSKRDPAHEWGKENSTGHRDPFLPPATIISAGKSQMPQKPAAVSEPEIIGPVWRGTVGTNLRRIAIIDFQGKTYLLSRGDALPGTAYKVVMIGDDSVLLDSPGRKLKLAKDGGK